MTDKEFNLEQYLSLGVESIVKSALKVSLSNPKQSIFFTKFALTSRKASLYRIEAQKKGEHIPPFLIASITQACNLKCAGCYSSDIISKKKSDIKEMLDAKTWERIFKEAASIGIVFILLAGGEPLLRMDVIAKAASIPEILFPLFTNGTLVKEENIKLFDKNRNLIPVLSLEGNEETTDRRRGKGVYQSLTSLMGNLKKKGILFGVSITITVRNIKEVLSYDFVESLQKNGCKLIFYVEYVPINEITKSLAPKDEERSLLEKELFFLRKKYKDIIFISFPGDEKASNGCLAAGRGFFHINSYGEAEPCPFSPYSDINVKDVGIEKALKSKMFVALRNSGLLTESHEGGCVLFKREDEVRKIKGS